MFVYRDGIRRGRGYFAKDKGVKAEGGLFSRSTDLEVSLLAYQRLKHLTQPWYPPPGHKVREYIP